MLFSVTKKKIDRHVRRHEYDQSSNMKTKQFKTMPAMSKFSDHFGGWV